jgi:hypothetical protein
VRCGEQGVVGGGRLSGMGGCGRTFSGIEVVGFVVEG